MRVDKIGENQLLVILCDKDMEDYSLDFETLGLDNMHSRRMLLKIMQVACKKTGIESRGRSVSIEALSLEEQCWLLLTLEENRKSHRERADCVCFCFDESESFLSALERLYKMNVCCNKNSAYLLNEKYYLIFDYQAVPKSVLHVLSEYGRRASGKVKAAKIREHGKLICKHNAILRIGGALV